MSRTVTHLDQHRVYAVRGTHAYGCGGAESSDTDADGQQHFLLTGPDAQDRLEATLPAWHLLWLRDGFTATDPGLAPAEAQLTALGLAMPPAPPAPREWGPGWAGSLADWRGAHAAAVAEQEQWRRSVQDTLQAGRVELWRRAGAFAVDAWLPTERVLVHDFGCRCTCWTEGWGQGWARLHVCDDGVYTTPDDMTPAGLSACLERARNGAVEARANATASKDKVLAKLRTPDLTLPPGPLDPDEANLTYPQWLARRTQIASERRAVVEAGLPVAPGPRAQAWMSPVAPDVAYARALVRNLEAADVAVLAADDVERVLAALT